MVKQRSPKPSFPVRVGVGPPILRFDEINPFLFLRLLMERALLAPTTILLERNLMLGQFLAILPAPIVNPLAVLTN